MPVLILSSVETKFLHGDFLPLTSDAVAVERKVMLVLV